jgi:hypothetical protein
MGTYGHLVRPFGHLWALHSGHSWSLTVTRGQSKALEIIALSTKIVGAGDGDRTRMASLEGWSSTIELHPRVSNETRRSLDDTVNVVMWNQRSMTRWVVNPSLNVWSQHFTERSKRTKSFVRCTPTSSPIPIVTSPRFSFSTGAGPQRTCKNEGTRAFECDMLPFESIGRPVTRGSRQ